MVCRARRLTLKGESGSTDELVPHIKWTREASQVLRHDVECVSPHCYST